LKRTKWNTLKKEAKVEYEDKKSIFIAKARPVQSTQEAMDFLLSVRAEYPDANHHVYAWRVSQEMVHQKYSDDGEPSGTAGLPVLEVLSKNEIDDAVVVVTRYFGGTLLGTGGLVRAYGRSALLAVKEAVPITCCVCELYKIMISYSYLDKVLFALKKKGYIIKSSEYGMDPVLQVGCLTGEKDELIHLCTELTAGQAVVEFFGEEVLHEGRLGELQVE